MHTSAPEATTGAPRQSPSAESDGTPTESPSASLSDVEGPGPRSGLPLSSGGIDAQGPTAPAEEPALSAEIDDAVELETGVTLEVVSIEDFEVKAQTPGEVDGPAVVVTLKATNESRTEQSIGHAVVYLFDEDGQLASGSTAGPGRPFAGSLEPGASAEASYVFMLDEAHQDITISVSYSADAPTVDFMGSRP